MQTAFASILLAALVHQALAVLLITNPIASTTAQGGQTLTVNWMDNGTAPTLAQIGPCEVGVFAGNVQQQTELQPIAASVDVSKQSSQVFTVNASIGPDSGAYFIRFTSLAFKDPNNPQFNFEAFSAKFTLAGMTGQFSPAVQAQITGITSAAAATATPAAASAGAASGSSAVNTAAKISTTTLPATAKSASSSSSAPKSTQSANAAIATRSSMVVLTIVGVVVALVL